MKSRLDSRETNELLIDVDIIRGNEEEPLPRYTEGAKDLRTSKSLPTNVEVS